MTHFITCTLLSEVGEERENPTQKLLRVFFFPDEPGARPVMTLKNVIYFNSVMQVYYVHTTSMWSTWYVRLNVNREALLTRLRHFEVRICLVHVRM